MDRTGLLFDVHRPYHDKFAYKKALDYLANLRPKPNRIILGGDYADFKDISFFKDDPNRMSFKEELQDVRQGLAEIRSYFPRAELVFIKGNHEARLDRFLWSNAPQLSGIEETDIPSLLQFKKYRVKYVDNIKRMHKGGEPFKLGKIFILHGHEKKVSMGAINLARLFYLKCGTNVIAGHHHRADKYLTKLLNGRYEGSWTVGTLGKLSEPYSPINDWVHGWCYVDVFDDGMFEVHNKVLIEGRILNG